MIETVKLMITHIFRRPPPPSPKLYFLIYGPIFIRFGINGPHINGKWLKWLNWWLPIFSGPPPPKTVFSYLWTDFYMIWHKWSSHQWKMIGTVKFIIIHIFRAPIPPPPKIVFFTIWHKWSLLPISRPTVLPSPKTLYSYKSRTQVAWCILILLILGWNTETCISGYPLKHEKYESVSLKNFFQLL